MTSMIRSPVLPLLLRGNIYNLSPKGKSRHYYQALNSQKCCWSSNRDTDMFNVPILLKYIQLSCKRKSTHEVTIKPIIHSSIHSISKSHHYSQKEKWIKEPLATNKEKIQTLNPPHPHFVGYYVLLKMTTIKGPRISWNAMTIMTTEAFNFKQNSNAWKNNSATMRLESLCTNLDTNK